MIPLLVAKFRIVVITLGTAIPKAHGDELMSTPIPLSNIQQVAQTGRSNYAKATTKDQTMTVTMLMIIIPFMK